VISSLCGLVKSLSTMPRGVEKDVTVEQLYMIFILLSSHGSDAVIDHILSEDLTKESTAFLL
jgi:hypothetical protein